MSLKISEEFLNDAKFGWKVDHHMAVVQHSWAKRLDEQMVFEGNLREWGYDSIERMAIYKWRRSTR